MQSWKASFPHVSRILNRQLQRFLCDGQRRRNGLRPSFGSRAVSSGLPSMFDWLLLNLNVITCCDGLQRRKSPGLSLPFFLSDSSVLKTVMSQTQWTVWFMIYTVVLPVLVQRTYGPVKSGTCQSGDGAFTRRISLDVWLPAAHRSCSLLAPSWVIWSPA